MAIVLLLMSLLGGISGAAIAIYADLGWIIAFGAYVLGGMIGFMMSVPIALANSKRIDAQQAATSKLAA